MRTCQSCGLENPDDRDFCDCGEYLRWDPTGFMQAVTPEAAAEAAPPAEPAAPAQPAEPAQPQAAAPPPPPPAQPAQPAQPQAAAPPPPPPPITEDAPFQTYAAPPPPVPPTDEPPAEPDAGNGHHLVPTPPPQPAAPPPTAAAGGTLVQGAVPAPPPPPQQEAPPPPAMASITLKLPDEDASHDENLALGVDPGGRERIQAVVRNQSGIVDNYELKVAGLPDGWWTIYPNTLYLVPFGTGGTYE